MSNLLFAIPARGGSKRLPRKNIIKILSKPLIAYTIESSLKSNLCDEVYLCTEDNEIAEIAQRYGAKVFKLTKELTADDVSSTTPIIELYKDLLSKGRSYDYIFNLQPTSPLRNTYDIDKSFEAFMRQSADTLVSVTQTDPHYFHWALIKRNNSWKMYFDDLYMKERIYLPTIFRPNGAIKLAKTEILLKNKNFFGDNLGVYEMPEYRSIHIATEFDLLCAKSILVNNHKI